MIYTDSRCAFTVADVHDFGMLWKQHGFPTSSGNKILNGPYVQELLDAILFLPVNFAIIKILGHCKFDSLEARGNNLADMSKRNVACKGTTAAKPLS